MNQTSSQQNYKSIRQELIEHFPKKPYEIQLQIAELLHQALQEGKNKLAIIQSPTGTGKTYSLLVPLIVWLKKNKTKISKNQPWQQQKLGIPSWLKKPSEQKVERLLSEKKKKIEQAISINEAQKKLNQQKMKNIKTQNLSQQEIQIESDQQDPYKNLKRKNERKLQIFVQKQLKVEDESALPKIIFVSRTHSQLSQVINSIKQITKDSGQIKYIQIGSKEHLCINPAVNSNKSNISQRCQYILDHSKCEFFHNLSIKQFFDTNLQDANSLGNSHKLCPYYAARNLIEQCDILCVPYASVLNSQIRNRIGINIHNSIVVFDEGHNIIDNQKQLHSPEILMEDVLMFSQQIDEFAKTYENRLKISNYKLLIHLLEILRALVSTVQKYHQENQLQKYKKVKYLQFISEMSIKELKILKIIKYIQLNNLDQKLSYFNSNQPVMIDKNKPQAKAVLENKKISVAKINSILQFLLQFASFNEQKQVLLVKWLDCKSLKILCLQSNQIQNIVNKCRLAIVAGGTMQPLADFNSLLLKFKDKSIVKKYPHIIKKEQCNLFIVRKYQHKDIIFNHQTLNEEKYLAFVKQICKQTLAKVLKRTEKGGGIVVFIQNYRIVALFKEIFKSQSYYSRILFDDRQTHHSKKSLFQTFRQLVQKDHQNSYILVSVMGGKLSQGINFSDRLARSLVVFGLPYANIYSPQVIETIYQLQQNKKSSKKQYLESLCLRTLNQTIGRGVRHINDYVNIYLIDARFQGIKNKLSEWMRDRVNIINNIEDL